MNADIHRRAELVSRAFKSACLAELEALKPGNVHIFADGHGMVVQDFLHSAEAAAQVIAEPWLGVGERILCSIEATRQAVSHNTNLGIILLCAPLVHAALHGSSGSLRRDLQTVLDQLSTEDAILAYKAILLASPAGLGNSEKHDVGDPPQVTLLEAMREAYGRDDIARQYVNGYADIFDTGIAHYQEALDRWGRPAWATTAVYMGFLAEFPDTHIVRKYGKPIAQHVREQANALLQKMLATDNPKTCLRDLLKFDGELKSEGLNPGTSADLTVATVLAITLQNANYTGSE
jgi:triphosphoribosyl-dephospho-CoA synthase